MTASLPGVFNAQQFTDAGAPAAGYRLYTLAPSTTTHKVAYTDAAASIPHTYTSDGAGGLYIGLDARGELPAPLFLSAGGYDLALKTPAGATVWTRRATGLDDSSASLSADLASPATAKGAALIGTHGSTAWGDVQAFIDYITGPSGPLQLQWTRPDGTATPLDTLLRRIYPGRKNLADILDKVQAGGTVSFACYGDSLTYGQDESSDGQATQINGSSITRSRYPYPESLDTALGYMGVSRTVTNRGYPGDTSADGLTRWASASPTDVAILMYGTNDGKTRAVPLDTYRRNMAKMIERELAKGAVVILMSPPQVSDEATNENIKPYSAVLRDLAHEYDLIYIDACEQLSGLTNLHYSIGGTPDLVHLNSFAYSELGWHLSALLVNRDGASQHVSPTSIYYPVDFASRGGTLTASAAARSGYFSVLSPGQFLSIGVYCEDDVLPVIHSYKSSGAAARMRVLYAGNGTYRGLPLNELYHDPAVSLRASLTGPTLRRGYRTLIVSNEGTDNAVIEAVEFQDTAVSAVSHGMRMKSSALSGAFTSDALLASLGAGAWCVHADYGQRLAAPCRLSAYVRLSGTAGLMLLENRQQQTPVSDGLMILRTGNDLVIRELTAGTPTDYTTGGVGAFAAGAYTGEIDIDIDVSGTVRVYLDGSLKMTKAAASHTSGWPAIVANNGAGNKLVCYAAQVAGYVKGPY